MPHSATFEQEDSRDPLQISLSGLSLANPSTEEHETGAVERNHSGFNPFEKFLRLASEPALFVDDSNGVNPFKPYFVTATSVQSIQDLTRDTIPGHVSALRQLRQFTLQQKDALYIQGRQFQKKWNVPEQSFLNWKRLLSGCIEFPAVMLLNPSPWDHLPFQEMVDKSTTLTWLQETLAEMKLGLDNVIIFDAFPMVRDDDRDDVKKRMGLAKRDELARDSFALTKASLSLIRPRVLLSCQCCTKSQNEEWGFFDDRLARRLCSSLKKSLLGLVKVIEVDEHQIQVVQGIHPQCVMQYKPDLKGHLAGLFVQVFGPFGTWHSRRIAMHQDLRKAAEVLVRLSTSLRLQTQLYRRLCEQAAEFGVEQPVEVRQLKELEGQLT